MQQINEAYQRGDIESLHQIFDAEKNNPELIKGDDIGSALVRVIRKIAQVDNRISDIETAISDLQSTDLFHLFEAVEKETEKGIDLLDKMANELLSRISFLEQQMEKHHV
jgi:chaperonin cofactor prefoldin